MKRALLITLLLGVVAFTIRFETLGEPVQAGLGPYTPTFTYTHDEVAPDNPDILPVDDECPVGAPCKYLWWVEIPDGQPLQHPIFGISGAFPSSSIVAFADAAVVPDGAIVGKQTGSLRFGPVGACATVRCGTSIRVHLA